MRRYVEGNHGFEQLREDVDRLLRGLPNPFLQRSAATSGGYPALNIWEQEHEFFAEAEVPGVAAEDLDISVVGNQLTIKGCRREPSIEPTAFHRRERGTGDFVRTVSLPVDIDADHVSAELNHGVLRIRLPKAAAARPRKINVQSAQN